MDDEQRFDEDAAAKGEPPGPAGPVSVGADDREPPPVVVEEPAPEEAGYGYGV